jgi:uncharacterized protein YqeY
MNLEENVMQQLKEAMKNKNEGALRALRAIKAAILNAKTEKGAGEMTPEKEIAIINKLAKQRKESIEVFEKQNRFDLSIVEKEELEILQTFLPEQLSEEAIETLIKELIEQHQIQDAKEFGKIMGIANKALAGKAEGALIAKVIKSILQ